jgi:S1-C subfamily serine protease
VGIKVECPGCNAILTVADNLQGKKVRCPKCQQLAPVPGNAAPSSPTSVTAAAKPPVKTAPTAPVNTAPKQAVRPSESISKGPPPISRRRPAKHDADEEPKRSPNGRKSYRDDDEHSEDLPSRGKSESQSPMPWILGGVGGGLLILVVIIVVVVMGGSSEPQKEQAAQNNGMQPVAENTAKRQPAPPQLPKQVQVPQGEAPRQIEPDNTQKAKRATALLRVRLSTGQDATGSGFFALEKGLVFTNAHVLGMLNAASPPPPKVDIIVNSGEKNESTRHGRILGVDRVNDLAVLKIDGNIENLPEALAVDTTKNLVELTPVYIFGFPLGNLLGKNITISESKVSSLRKDSEGSIYQVQVNGGMHHGNSGGPVVDTRGVVIGVAVSGIEGTQLNFAVPGDKVLGLVRGQVVDVSLGESYRKDSQVKLPLELICLDPLNRLKEVQMEVWVGKHGPARPFTTQAPASLSGDGPRRTFAMTYQNSKAVVEIDLPNLNNDQSFWVQPIISDKTGAKHWGTAHAYKYADFLPLDRKAVVLQQQYDKEGDRTVKFGNIQKIGILKDGKQVTLGFNLELESVETAKKDTTGGNFRVFVVKHKFGVEEDGKPLADGKQIKLLTLFNGKSFTYETDPLGHLKKRSIPTLPKPAYPADLGAAFEEFAMDFSNAYEMTLISLPNREIQPKGGWDCKVPFFLTSPDGRKKEVVDMQLKCTLEGVRAAGGKDQAVINLKGTIVRRTNPPQIGGKVTGKAYYAIDQGFLTHVKLKKESAGLDDAHYVEVSLTRTPGNSTGVTPSTAPPAGGLPLNLAKGKIIYSSPSLTLGPGDSTNYPEKPGCYFKPFTFPCQAGKTYIIEMNRATEGPLDPFLVLLDPLNQKLATDDDSGGGLNARIIFKAPTTGIYKVLASSLEANQTGQFLLVISEAATNKQPAGSLAIQPGALDALKGKTVVVTFTVAESARKSAAERIKSAVGNKLTASRETTIGGKTTVQVTPVQNPQAFVDALKEVGQITKIEGNVIALTVKQAKADTPAKATAGKSKTPAKDASPITVALNSLGASNPFVARKAAEFLATTVIDDKRREDVIKILKNYLNTEDVFLKKSVIVAYGHWMLEEHHAGLYPVLLDSDVFSRSAAMLVLSKNPSANNAKEIAKRMEELADRMDAGKALRNMGAVAEPAVKDLLNSGEWTVRMDACKILSTIGTESSIPALEAKIGDENRLVGNAAKDAIVAIKNRLNIT